MKNIITTIILILSLNVSFGQGISAPKNAQETFEKDFNANNEATDINWLTEENNFVVYFEYNQKKRSVLFDQEGNYKENRIFIPIEKLNTLVSAYIEKNYDSNSIIQCYEVFSNTAPERNEVEIEINGEITTLFFRPNGEFHSKK